MEFVHSLHGTGIHSLLFVVSFSILNFATFDKIFIVYLTLPASTSQQLNSHYEVTDFVIHFIHLPMPELYIPKRRTKPKPN